MQTIGEDPHGRRRLAILGSAVVVGLVVVGSWRYTGVAFPYLQLRILVVALATIAGVAFLYRGVLLGFSRNGGWKTSATPLLWAGACLSMAASQLTAKTNLPLSIVMAVCALAAAVMQQREREARSS